MSPLPVRGNADSSRQLFSAPVDSRRGASALPCRNEHHAAVPGQELLCGLFVDAMREKRILAGVTRKRIGEPGAAELACELDAALHIEGERAGVERLWCRAQSARPLRTSSGLSAQCYLMCASSRAMALSASRTANAHTAQRSP